MRFAIRQPPLLRCSFCGKDDTQVARLVAGATAYICDACITACVRTLKSHGGFESESPELLPAPSPIR